MLVYIQRDMIQGTYTRRHDEQAYIDMILHTERQNTHVFIWRDDIQAHTQGDMIKNTETQGDLTPRQTQGDIIHRVLIVSVYSILPPWPVSA